MNRFLIAGIILLLPTALMAEANVKVDEQTKTFLLKAPGTLSGVGDLSGETDSAQPFAPSAQTPLRFKPQRDQRIDSLKFPQYGQVYGGRFNPWSEQESNRQLPPSLPPANPYFSNPWDLSGRLPAQQTAPAYSMTPYYSAGPRGHDQYSFGQGMSPDYPSGIYRDTNPASRPYFDSWMPGLGSDEFNFPFSPFKMF